MCALGREFRATHEYTHILRLVSKLPDLRVGCANPETKCKHFVSYPIPRAGSAKEKEKLVEVVFFFW